MLSFRTLPYIMMSRRMTENLLCSFIEKHWVLPALTIGLITKYTSYNDTACLLLAGEIQHLGFTEFTDKLSLISDLIERIPIRKENI